MAGNTEWSTYINTSENESNLRRLRGPRVEDHPLKTLTVTERLPRRILGSQSSTGRTTPVSTPTTILDISAALEGIDPLTKFAIEELDPLTQIANENAMKTANNMNQSSQKKQRESRDEIEPWDSRRTSILNQFTTSEKISIVTSFLNDDEQVIVKAQSSSIDKVQHRLEQLDYFEEGSQRKFDLSQVEYVRRIGQLNKELVSAWNSEQRVKALKIAIQCAKMLSDTDVLCFYPSKFVLITDILDVFGKLVYDRLRTKANYIKPGSKTPTALPEDFTPDMVPESAKETCRNWFYKIASIRELVPRIYVEMAILKSYSFLTSSEYSAALLRLTGMIRGIGNPLVSTYARCYLCRVGLSVTSSTGKDNKYLMENFYDFLNLYEHLFSGSVKREITKQNVDITLYLTLYTPALEFILQAVACGAPETMLTQILDKCQRRGNSSLLLNTIMAVFKANFVSPRCVQFLEMVYDCRDEGGFPPHVLLRTLGLCVTVCPPAADLRRQVLTLAWRRISEIENPEHYLNCAEPWVQYTVQYFMNREGEVNLILGDLIRHVSYERVYERFYPQLKMIMEKIVMYTQDIEALLAMDNFLPLIDLFQQETVRAEVCKTVLLACVNESPVNDPVIINTLVFLCGTLHDSVNAMTIDDEYRQISDIIAAIVRRINYGRDFEQQLTFYVEARGALSNLYPVLAQLVQCTNLLATRTRAIVNGHHTRKTGAFVRACAAYCFITIPSISSARTRLDLYLLSGQVALFNNCLGQADAFFKTALSIIPELSNPEERRRDTEAFLCTYIKKFLSVLLVVPDSPDRGVLNLTRVLLNVIQNYPWLEQHHCADLYLNVLDMLSAMAQEKYPYYVDKVECNDTLYGSDPKFVAEIDKICGIVLSELLVKLKELNVTAQKSQMALKLAVTMINRMDVAVNTPTPTLILNLWQLALKHGNIDTKYLIRTKDYYTRKFDARETILKQVVSKFSIR